MIERFQTVYALFAVSFLVMTLGMTPASGTGCVEPAEYTQIETVKDEHGCDALTRAHLAIRAGRGLTFEDFGAIADASTGTAYLYVEDGFGGGDVISLPLIDAARLQIIDEYGIGAGQTRGLVYFYRVELLYLERMAQLVSKDEMPGLETTLKHVIADLKTVMLDGGYLRGDNWDQYVRCFMKNDHLALPWAEITESKGFKRCMK